MFRASDAVDQAMSTSAQCLCLLFVIYEHLLVMSLLVYFKQMEECKIFARILNITVNVRLVNTNNDDTQKKIYGIMVIWMVI